jgi:hypothetical protein
MVFHSRSFALAPGAATSVDDESAIPGLKPWRRGKVRSVYEAGPEHLVLVASDRLSAYDSVLPTPIPGKGRVLTTLSGFWMRTLEHAAPHHLVSDDPREFPAPFNQHVARLEGRSHYVKRADRVDIECVVRGYLTGSGWKEYQQSRTVCGIALPEGLRDGSKLEPAIFTPATKADEGHDENIPFERMIELAGRGVAEARHLRRSARSCLDSRPGARRHEVRVRIRGRAADVDRRGTLARLVALLGPRGVRGRPAAVVRQAVRARLARSVGLESRAASAGASA